MADYKKRPGTISYGVTSFGYDMRIRDTYKIFTNVNSTIIDPKAMNDKCFIEHKGPFCIIPPNSYVLAESVEYFDMPENVIAICVGKSTYARAGIYVNVTPIEPGFKGTVVVEIGNATPLPAKVYSNEGIAQLMFFKGNTPTINYGNKNGKYQEQSGIVLSRVD